MYPTRADDNETIIHSLIIPDDPAMHMPIGARKLHREGFADVDDAPVRIRWTCRHTSVFIRHLELRLDRYSVIEVILVLYVGCINNIDVFHTSKGYTQPEYHLSSRVYSSG